MRDIKICAWLTAAYSRQQKLPSLQSVLNGGNGAHVDLVQAALDDEQTRGWFPDEQ